VNTNNHIEAVTTAPVTEGSSLTPDTASEEVETVSLSKEDKLSAVETALGNIPPEYFTVIRSEEWKTWELETILKFILEYKSFAQFANDLRSTLDKAIWAGHADGTVDPTVESIRTQTESDKPKGRKPIEMTEAERMLKKLGG
jgi:hypothetical protein